MHPLRRAAALAAFSVSLSGCLAVAAGTAAGVGVYAYQRGELWATVPSSLDAAYQASLATLEELDLEVVQSSRDAFGGRVMATQVQGGRVTINLIRDADRLTRIGIRVGTFGDEGKARFILAKIQEHL